MNKDILLVRVYISEADHGRHKSLLEEIFALLHDQHRVRGVTVFRGIAGFGTKGEVHSADLLRLTTRLPLVVEFFDEPTIAEAAMNTIKELVPPGHVVYWHAQCECPES
ncbi:MAG: DUF190 domain-containing protein [Acidiferrobacterales bacterium]